MNNLWVGAIALFPFIFIRKKSLAQQNHRLINHERIHLAQQLELLILPFYIFYLIHYCINILKYHSHQAAYLNIVFEREAYANDNIPGYLDRRNLWAFLTYL